MTAVKTRKDLYNHLELKMTKSYEDLVDDSKYEKGNNLLKTYIIEANDHIKKILKSNHNVCKIKETDDKNLYVVYDRNRHEYYVDCYDPYSKNSRFWLIHSTERSEASDKFIDNILLNGMSHLDYLWIIRSKLLKQSKKHGKLRGMGIRHENSMFSSIFKDSDSLNHISIKSWGTLPEEIYSSLKSVNALSIKNTTLEKTVGSPSENRKLIETVYRTGKFSARGNASIEEHIAVVDDFRGNYYNYLKLIEEEYRMRYSVKDNSLSIKGSPLYISFKKEIPDIEKFLKIIASGKNPFRIAGIVKKLEEGYYGVRGVDLHNGDELCIESTNNWMRLYLKNNACGNTALRLVSILQEHYDSETKIEGV